MPRRLTREQLQDKRARQDRQCARPGRPHAGSAHGPVGTTLPARTARPCTLRPSFRRGFVRCDFRRGRLCALATSFREGRAHRSPPALRIPPSERPSQCAWPDRPHREQRSPGSKTWHNLNVRATSSSAVNQGPDQRHDPATATNPCHVAHVKCGNSPLKIAPTGKCGRTPSPSWR